MQLAVNYSEKLAALMRAGDVRIDYFKCPAWPDLIPQAVALHPTYVHFPLVINRAGIIDSEEKAPVNWGKIERLMQASETEIVNLHFIATPEDYPEIPHHSTVPEHMAIVREAAIKAVQPLIQRFGKDHVIIENHPGSFGRMPHVSIWPDVLTEIIEALDCGLLFDLSHARLAARLLGMDEKAYIQRLPVNRIREMHVTGIRRFEPAWAEKLTAGVEQSMIDRLIGQEVDHLPFTDVDWAMLEWVFSQIHAGEFQAPWVVTFEYGGVGGIWEAMVTTKTLQEQVPRLYAMVHD